jgi:hypothetical protein
MKKDIFIDNNAALRFTNPPTDSYKELIKWLIEHNGTGRDAYLVISQKILQEYTASLGGSTKVNNMLYIIDLLTRQNRLQRFTNAQINTFQDKYFTNKVLKKLKCNYKDRFHIPVILMSDRKITLIEDLKFLNDTINFPGFEARAATNPETLNYK